MLHNATPMSESLQSVAPRRLQRNVPLAPFTTLGIGGPARLFIRAETVDEIREALSWTAAQHEPLFILGGGSNVLIADEGFDGVVLQIDLRGITVRAVDAEAVTVYVAAGEKWDDFVSFAVDRGWAGIECLSGIPGLTGATPIQNVGAYGQDVSETIIRVEVIERDTGRVVTLTNWECGFGYRQSVFKAAAKDRYIVAGVTFRLKPGGAASIRYPELQTYLSERAIDLHDLRAVREAVIAIRKRKGMVLDPTDPDTRSDGSFFMNPVVTPTEFDDLLRRAGTKNIPHFPSGDQIKLSAAWLIENSGFHKGFVHGNVGLSSKHTLAVINRGGGSAREVIELVRMIQGGVRTTFGIEIHPEPNFIGL
ncbi:MAG TPA: UDP-N-acetylmuramate dehydrogenase [Thermoanaerobaculia bacterium]|jgi:UDP-N-acetylmuramate dehydrogenase|nr:UDP-N-acetylmuramate dehydrogenase [Thermoanaerobaculia bacterium]